MDEAVNGGAPSGLAAWLDAHAADPVFEEWSEVLAELAAVRRPQRLWQVIEPLMQRTLDCDDVCLVFLPREIATPQLIFSTGRYLEGQQRQKLEQEMAAAPVFPLLAANPGIPLLTWRNHSRDEADFRSTDIFREHMQARGQLFVMGLCFWDEQNRPLAMVVVHRRIGRADFSDADEARALRLRPFLDAAIRQTLASATHHAVLRGLERSGRESSNPSILVSLQGVVLSGNRAGREALNEWGVATSNELPADLAASVARLRYAISEALRSRGELPGQDLVECVNHLSATGRRARVRLLNAAGAFPAEPVAWIQFERDRSRASEPSGDHEELLGRLTVRERELVECVRKGRTNREAAAELGKSISTVKFQLHHAYEKLGVSNRQQLIVLLR